MILYVEGTINEQRNELAIRIINLAFSANSQSSGQVSLSLPFWLFLWPDYEWPTVFFWDVPPQNAGEHHVSTFNQAFPTRQNRSHQNHFRKPQSNNHSKFQPTRNQTNGSPSRNSQFQQSNYQFYSNMLVIPKHNGGCRPVFNLKSLDQYLYVFHFKMEDVKQVIR
ncbi:hypothetical protein CLU79DRAFT_831864 [Phycomyces nitens]|nr:hypothetical protein CLU79DRAFT_831864 [Phycomyces nitens]